MINNLSRRVNFGLCRNNGQPQGIGDCHLCLEFAHFLSIFKTLERENPNYENKNPVACHHFETDVSFVSRVNMQGNNMKTAPAEFDVTFNFAIYSNSQKYDRKIERSKNLPKCFRRW